MFSHDCHHLSYVSLLTLEVAIPNSVLKKIKEADINFRKAWLQDEVIAAYLQCLQCKYDGIKYCAPTEAMCLSLSRSVKLLWSNENLSDIKLVLIPFNPSGIHWVLIVLNIDSDEILILDPMAKGYIKDNNHHQLCVKVGMELFSRKFRKHKIQAISSRDHILQADSFNCGVFVCYYAKQLCEGNLEFCYESFKSVNFESIFNALCINMHFSPNCYCSHYNISGGSLISCLTQEISGKRFTTFLLEIV